MLVRAFDYVVSGKGECLLLLLIVCQVLDDFLHCPQIFGSYGKTFLRLGRDILFFDARGALRRHTLLVLQISIDSNSRCGFCHLKKVVRWRMEKLRLSSARRDSVNAR